MDKSDVKVHESQSDTSSVITMKEYAPSEYPSSEPPPAYMKPRSNALRIATLLAFTVIVSSIILGGFLLAASWIQANTARNLDLTLNQELLDDLHPSYDHLVANEILPEQQHNSVEQEVTKNEAKDYNQAPSNGDKIVDKTNDKSIDENLLPPPPPPSPSAKTEEKKALDLDEIANILMQKNIKGNVNCIVEKRRNEELVDHAPMSLNLPSGNSPFGLNITTPPRLQHLTGEQMIVICKGDEDEEKDSDSDEEGDEDDGKVDQFQSIVLPLPSHLLNQIQQVPQIIPLNHILQHLPVQQIPMQVPVQQVPVQQVPVQQIPIQQITVPQFPQHQPQPPQQPQQIIYHQPQPQQQQPQIIYQQQPQQQMFIVEQQQQQPQPQPQPQQQMILPQRLLFPQQQIVNNAQPNIPFAPEMIPLKEVRINQDRIPVNHVLHHRVPINPMAVNDIPIARMPITHLPMRAEPQIREEPVPVHHLMPPQPQQYQAENFKQEEPRFNGPIIQESVNRFPFSQPQSNQPRLLPVEVRDPGVLRMPGPMPQEPERYQMPPPVNQFFSNMLPENREPELLEEAPNRGFRQPVVDVRSRGQRREPIIPEMPKMNPMIPMNFERRPQGNGRRIRFPEMVDSEEVRENRLPIITEITKIIPIRLEKEETEVNESPMIPLNPNIPPKNMEAPEIKIEKLPPRPFPIPINAILDMIFRGIRPLMNNRGHPLPIPIDIKIERIENKPLGLLNTPPFIKKFEIIKKVTPVNDEASQNSNVESVSEEKTENENVPDKGVVEAKVERVEIFDRENENGHPIPIPADAQDPQIFKIEDAGKQSEVSEAGSFEDEAFLPNGQGRGARVFPIPQRVKEAEIFSVFDAKSDKNVDGEIPMESSITVMNPEREKAPEAPAENGQGIHLLPTPLLNFFPISEDKVEPVSKVRPQTFTVPESRSVKLYPVANADFKTEEMKPMDSGSAEENRPHFVQPRSV